MPGYSYIRYSNSNSHAGKSSLGLETTHHNGTKLERYDSVFNSNYLLYLTPVPTSAPDVVVQISSVRVVGPPQPSYQDVWRPVQRPYATHGTNYD